MTQGPEEVDVLGTTTMKSQLLENLANYGVIRSDVWDSIGSRPGVAADFKGLMYIYGY